jgi:hypothetical protein
VIIDTLEGMGRKRSASSVGGSTSRTREPSRMPSFFGSGVVE